MSADESRTRRRLLTGGAVVLGAAVVGSEGTAQAANGGPLLIGRANVGSAETKLTNSSSVPALNVISTGTAHAGLLTARNKDRWGVWAISEATGIGAGGAIRADGRKNTGLSAGTANNSATAITARNTAPSNGQFQERAIVATAGNGQAELASWGFPSQPSILAAGHHGIAGVCDGQGTGARAGVLGLARHTDSVGVYGAAFAPALALRADGESRLFGNVGISGTLSKSAGSFKIDHPLDPANKYLSHSFVESPDMLNVYNGNVLADANGEATVELPEWFEALNKDFRYQLTPIGSGAPDLHVKAKVADGRFAIGGAKPGQEVSWQLTGIRHDAYADEHRIKVEETKPAKEKGTYLFPKGFGKPEVSALGAATAAVVRR